jgi:uncharacterized protein YndB with AHSA1/START domain
VTDPLRITFDVACPPARAFDLWTRQTSVWWPRSHTVSGQPNVEVVIEPGVGGRVFERTPAGEEHDWGRVTAWDPPIRLAYLWHLRQDRADATEVEIAFAATDQTGTTVSIDHRGWDALGARGPDQRERNQHGWDRLLPHFKTAANRLPE